MGPFVTTFNARVDYLLKTLQLTHYYLHIKQMWD